MPGGIHGHSPCTSPGQTRCGCRRSRDTGKSPARYLAARIHTVVRNPHHRSAQRLQNSHPRSGNNPNLAGDGVGKCRRAMLSFLPETLFQSIAVPVAIYNMDFMSHASVSRKASGEALQGGVQAGLLSAASFRVADLVSLCGSIHDAPHK